MKKKTIFKVKFAIIFGGIKMLLMDQMGSCFYLNFQLSSLLGNYIAITALWLHSDIIVNYKE